jgi:hypothetical protein
LVAWLHWDEIVGYNGPGSPIPALGYPMRIGMLLVSGIAAGLVGWLARRAKEDNHQPLNHQPRRHARR